jgi:cell volume regulation protein A
VESIHIEIWLLVSGILLALGVLSSKLSERIGVPALLMFLLLGMLAGSEGLGGIYFDSPEIAQTIGTLALVVILFAGGLDTSWSAIKPVLVPGMILATFGVLITAGVLACFVWLILADYDTFQIGLSGIGWMEALLLAAIVSSTDAAAVFSVFRTSPVQPTPRLRSLLECESGSNDPMAVLLTTTLLGIMVGQTSSTGAIILSLLSELLLGSAVGLLLGHTAVWLIKHARLSSPGLYPVLVLSAGLCTFGLAYLVHGNGFLAVYVAGVVIGNGVPRSQRRLVLTFHDGLSWVCQITMFIALGLLVFPSQLVPVAGVSVVIALFLILVARPLSVFICLLPFSFKTNEKAYTSWVGLRGSVPIVLATFPASYGIAGAEVIFNVVFFIVLTSMLLQGLTLVRSARWLGVVDDD